MYTYLQNHEDLGGGLYHLVETTDVLMRQVLHGLDLHLHTGQVILRERKRGIFAYSVEFLKCCFSCCLLLLSPEYCEQDRPR